VYLNEGWAERSSVAWLHGLKIQVQMIAIHLSNKNMFLGGIIYFACFRTCSDLSSPSHRKAKVWARSNCSRTPYQSFSKLCSKSTYTTRLLINQTFTEVCRSSSPCYLRLYMWKIVRLPQYFSKLKSLIKNRYRSTFHNLLNTNGL